MSSLGKTMSFYWVDHSVVFSTDGTTVAFGSMDDMINVWDVKKEKSSKFSKEIQNVYWPTDGTIVASGAEDTTINIYNVEESKFINTLKGYSAKVWLLHF